MQQAWQALIKLTDLEVNTVLQEGRYIPGVQTQTNHTLPDYTVFPFADIQDQVDMMPVLGTCFANTTGLSILPALSQQVNDCADKRALCCYTNLGQVSPY